MPIKEKEEVDSIKSKVDLIIEKHLQMVRDIKSKLKYVLKAEQQIITKEKFNGLEKMMGVEDQLIFVDRLNKKLPEEIKMLLNVFK